MAELEKKNSQALSNTNDDFLDWNEYDEEYEEDDKIEIQNETTNTESKTTNQKDSEEIEDDGYNNRYSRSKTNKEYGYNTFRGKNYSSYYNNRGGFGNKKFIKQSKPFNKGGYDNNSYYHRGTYYKKKQNNDIYNNNKDFYKYNKEHNYESKKEYKTVEKDYDYNNQNDYDKKTDRRSFKDNNYGKKYNYSSRYKNGDYNTNKNGLSYSTREFIDDGKKYSNKNNKYKSDYKNFTKEEEIEEKSDDVLSKPQFFNSKIGNTQEAPINQQKYIKTGDFILIDNLINNINKIVKDTYISLKSKVAKNIEEQYGTLNINAQTYVPKKKMLNLNNINNINNMNNMNNNNNINYGPGIVNNNNNPQNYYMPPYI